MLVAHPTKGLLNKDDIKRIRSIYKKYAPGGMLGSINQYLSDDSILNKDLFGTEAKKATAIDFGKAINPDNKYFNPDMAKIQGSFDSVNSTFKGQPKPDWKGGLNATVPYLSNIVNSFRRLPQPNAPLTEDYIDSNLVNFDAQRGEIKNLQSNTNAGLDYRVANPAIRQALKGQTLSAVISGMNNLAEKEGNLNAGIKNQTAQANSVIGARNTERMNNYRSELVSRKMNQQRLDSENFANLSDKYQMNQRDKSLMDLENRKLDILPKLYKDTGVFDRNLVENYIKEKYKSNTKKFGGKMKPISASIK
jgi:hypothetical protein